MQIEFAGFLLPTRSSGCAVKIDTPALPRDTELSRLEKLPTELLTAVFDHAFVGWDELESGTARLLDPLSRKLQSFVRRNLFWEIRLEEAAFCRFAEATRDSPEIKELVEVILIGPPWDAVAPNKQTLFDFFRAATSLTSLYIEDASVIQQTILSAKFALVCFPALESLRLVGEIPCHSDNSLRHQFRNLPLFPKLDSLELLSVGSVERRERLDVGESGEEESIRQVYEHFNGVLPARSSLPYLEIIVEDYFDHVTLGDFLSDFDSLRTLNFVAYPTDNILPLASILERVSPDRLIKFDFSRQDDMPNPILLDDVLPRFVHLESITMPFDTLTTAFTDSLRRLPKLKDIQLENREHLKTPMPYTLNFSPIARILSGPTALSSLIRLDISPPLHSVSFHHLAADYRPSCDRGTGVVIPYRRWTPPNWPATCSREQAKEIIRLATEKKVEFVSEERFKVAIENSERYDEEVEWCARQPRVILDDSGY